MVKQDGPAARFSRKSGGIEVVKWKCIFRSLRPKKINKYNKNKALRL
jgi:hypothetical protein